MHVSERRACAALGQHRSTQRKVPRGRDDEERLTADTIALARQYGRYGYRKIAGLLEQAGWLVNDKRVERIWRREGLKVPHKQPKRGRLWLADGSCIRLRPEHRNHVWSYDFVEDRTHDGRKYRMLNVIDEFTHECLAIRVARKLKAIDVIDVLSDLFILRGIPGHIRSDNGPEFVAKAVREWIAAVGAKTAYIEPGSPWENGYVESFNARLRDELLDGEIFYTLREAQIVIESWRRHFNAIRPHEITRLQAAGTRGVRASIRRVAGCATSTGSAGHAPAGPTASTKLTFRSDHSVGADHAEPAGYTLSTEASRPRRQDRAKNFRAARGRE
jgi:transposase InsO family protein